MKAGGIAEQQGHEQTPLTKCRCKVVARSDAKGGTGMPDLALDNRANWHSKGVAPSGSRPDYANLVVATTQKPDGMEMPREKWLRLHLFRSRYACGQYCNCVFLWCMHCEGVGGSSTRG